MEQLDDHLNLFDGQHISWSEFVISLGVVEALACRLHRLRLHFRFPRALPVLEMVDQLPCALLAVRSENTTVNVSLIFNPLLLDTHTDLAHAV